MRYVIDITPQQAQAIQKYLDNGSYNSITQFISTSIENQLSLELEDNLPSGLKPYQSEQVTQKETNKIAKTDNAVFTRYYLRNILPYNNTIAVPEFENLVFASKKIPEDQAWIWGQVNKIFPVKLGLRILHECLSVNPSIELNEFLKVVADEAVLIGNKIREYEAKSNKMRDEKISVALPASDDKSQNRYKFQFIAYQRKDKLLDGAMALMRFCNIYTDKKKQMIGITKPGLKFSLISNPVIDNNEFDISLNEEESLFYVNHIKKYVRGEYEAIHWMLEKIKNGQNERELLNTEIKEAFGKIWKATPAVINTQRAGITARMTELGLIEKEKDGIYVKYGVSEIGRKLFFK